MPFRTADVAPVDIYVASCSPFDPVTGSTVSVNLTTFKYLNTESTDSPASTTFRPGMQINGFKLSSLDLDTGMIGGFLSGAQGELLIPNTDRELDPWIRYSWVGRVLEVKRIPKGSTYKAASGGTSVIKGYVTGVSADRRWLRISFESFDSVLERKPLSPYKYWGRPRALRFGSASSHYVSCGDNVDITGNCTIEVFLKINSNDATTKYLVKKQSGTTGYYLNVASTEVLRASFDGGITNAFSTTALTVGEWVFVSVVFDNAGNTVKFYLNGVLDATVAYTAGPPTNTAHTLFLGGDGSTNSANCDIGEVRVWNTARTQQQILENLYGGISSSSVPASLVGWWRFEEGTGATLNDTSATNANGTITGATWFGTFEGDEALGGRRKPIGYGGATTDNLDANTGQPHIEPVLIDSQKLIYAVDIRGFQASMSGAVPPIKAYDGGNEITSGGNNTDLWSTTVSAGQFKYDQSRGLIRLNAATSQKLSVRYQAIGGSGTPNSMLSELLQTSAGFSSGDIGLVAGDWSAFNVGLGSGGAMVHSLDGEMTCADAVRQILHSFRAWGGFGEAGLFLAEPITKANVENSPTISITDQQFSNLTLIGVLPPVKSVLVQYRPHLPPLQDQEVSGSVSADAKRDLMKNYRDVRVERVLDRFGRAFTEYKEDARELVLQTVLNQPEQAVVFGTSLLDLFDTFVPIWEFELSDQEVALDPTKPIRIGREITITDPAFSLNGGVDCLIVGVSRSISGANCRLLVQVAEVQTLAS